MDNYSDRIKRLCDLGSKIGLPPEMPHWYLVLRELSKLAEATELTKDDIAFLDRVEAFNTEGVVPTIFVTVNGPYVDYGFVDGEFGRIFHDLTFARIAKSEAK